MMIKYHPSALTELVEAFEWYEQQQEGLGSKFIADVELAIKRIIHFPLSNPVLDKGYRRAVLPVFPFGLFYKVKEEGVEVYAVAHLHRMPFYWIRRKMS